MFEEYKHHEPLQAVERVFRIIETLAVNPQGLHLTELAEKTGLHSSTVHRLLHTLVSLGYVRNRKESGGKYKLSYKLYEYSSYYLEGQTFIEGSLPFLNKLSSDISLPVHLFVPEVFDVVSVSRSTVGDSFSLNLSSGFRIPMYCCSAGKVILACYDMGRVEALWEKFGHTAFTPYTLTSLEDLKESLKTVKRQGYAISVNEYRAGVSGISVPLNTANGRTVGALGILAPTGSYPSERLSELSGELLHSATVLSKKLNETDGIAL